MNKNKKVIILIVILVIIALGITGIFIYKNRSIDNIVIGESNRNQMQDNNEQENIIDNANIEIENTIAEENSINNKIENTNNEENITENKKIEEQTEEITQSKTEQTQQKKNTTTSSSSKNKSTSQTTNSQNNKSTTANQPQTSVTQKEETSKSNEQQNTNTTSTKKETAYWCIDGGTHHIAGDGNDEHGYYKTWEQADAAAKEFMNKNSLYHYKVNSCACGLYYFQAR